MAAINGARGTPDVTESDREGGYNHLSRHYEQFDRDPPDFRETLGENRMPPEREYKSRPHFTKNIDGRTVTGIFAVHGNIDEGGDMSINGSFGRRLNNGQRQRARFLWNHNSMNPPIASIDEIKEVQRNDLPQRVLNYAPEATGGVQVTRTYYDGIDLADWVLAGVKAGDIDEMSYAYEVHDDELEERDGRDVRILKDVEIFDISDVNWGLNPATAGVKGFLGSGYPFSQHGDAVVSAVAGYVERVKERQEIRAKEGRVLSSANRRRIKALVKSLQEVTTDLQQLLEETDPDKAAKNAARVRQLHAEFLQIESELLGAMA